MTPISLLDLAPIVDGGDASLALRRSRDLARHAETLGYHRFWLAEHHNMPGIASAATAVAIGYVAEGTTRIRIGAGGIMLPNHAPLTVAEQFGTLAALYPDRIDLGIGRAPGSDQVTAQALRRTLSGGADRFPEDLLELLDYFEPVRPGQLVQAVPGAGMKVPVWILGSSLYGAQVAAAFGLPYAFASHFAPEQLLPACQLYRDQFRPSGWLEAPHLMLALNLFAAASDREAERLFTSQQQAFANLRRGRPGPLPLPVDDIAAVLTPAEIAMTDQALAMRVVGGPATVKAGLAAFVARYRPDELILTANIHDHQARLQSFRIAAEAAGYGEQR